MVWLIAIGVTVGLLAVMYFTHSSTVMLLVVVGSALWVAMDSTIIGLRRWLGREGRTECEGTYGVILRLALSK